MDAAHVDLSFFFTKLILPLLRLSLTMALGLLAATLLEALHWNRIMARLASPLVRFARLSETAGAAFSAAFFSPAVANALLAEQVAAGAMSRRECILSNLFNSSPAYLVHLPSLLAVTYAFLGAHAFTYIGLTFLAATLRTVGTALVARRLLPLHPHSAARTRPDAAQVNKEDRRKIVERAIVRFAGRLRRLLMFTVPVYCLVFAAQQAGWFGAAERFLAAHISLFTFLDPKAVGIAALYISAESNLALSAAAPLLASGALGIHQVIVALLLGNILSSPMRAFRHQFPAYAGYFRPRLAFQMVLISQLCRVGSLCVITGAYIWNK